MECVELRGFCDSFILGGAAGQPANQLRACACCFLAKKDSCKVVGGCSDFALGPDEATHDKLRGEYAVGL